MHSSQGLQLKHLQVWRDGPSWRVDRHPSSQGQIEGTNKDVKGHNEYHWELEHVWHNDPQEDPHVHTRGPAGGVVEQSYTWIEPGYAPRTVA